VSLDASPPLFFFVGQDALTHEPGCSAHATRLSRKKTKKKSRGLGQYFVSWGSFSPLTWCKHRPMYSLGLLKPGNSRFWW
jgi:hypothetical protein